MTREELAMKILDRFERLIRVMQSLQQFKKERGI